MAELVDLSLQPTVNVRDRQDLGKGFSLCWDIDKVVAALIKLGALSVTLSDDAPASGLGLWFRRDQAVSPLPSRGTNGPGDLFVNLNEGAGWEPLTEALFVAYLAKRGGLGKGTDIDAEASRALAAEGLLGARVSVLETAYNSSPIDADFSIVTRALSTPPVSPALTSRYLIATPGAGAWTGQSGIAEWTPVGWSYTALAEGVFYWIDDENALFTWDGSNLLRIGGPSGPLVASSLDLPPHTVDDRFVSPLKLYEALGLEPYGRRVWDTMVADTVPGGMMEQLRSQASSGPAVGSSPALGSLAAFSAGDGTWSIDFGVRDHDEPVACYLSTFYTGGGNVEMEASLDGGVSWHALPSNVVLPSTAGIFTAHRYNLNTGLWSYGFSPIGQGAASASSTARTPGTAVKLRYRATTGAPMDMLNSWLRYRPIF